MADAAFIPYPPPAGAATATAALATATPIPTGTTTTTTTTTPDLSQHAATHPPHRPPNPGECSLLGPFAIFIQLALGALALLSLVWKRWRERPQRPVRIWFFDVSKQVFGSVLVHAANVFMSLLTSGKFSIESAEVVAASAVTRVVRRAVVGGMMVLGTVATEGSVVRRGEDGNNGGGGDGEYQPNPCSFYLLNLAIDTTIGIPILIVIVRCLTYLVSFTPLGNPPESIQSGNYGTPPNAWWWFKQSIIYFCGLMGMKFCVLIIFILCPWLPRVGDWALGWTEGNEKLQIFFVMMLFPLIMNALQYYIIDSYIKKQDGRSSSDGHHHHHHHRPGSSSHPTAATGHSRPGVPYDQLESSSSDTDADDSDSDDSDDSEAGARKALNRRRRSSHGHHHQHRHVRGTHVRLARRDSAAHNTTSSSGSGSGSGGTRDQAVTTEYDPAVDGDSPTIVGSSSSSRLSARRALPKE